MKILIEMLEIWLRSRSFCICDKQTPIYYSIRNYTSERIYLYIMKTYFNYARKELKSQIRKLMVNPVEN